MSKPRQQARRRSRGWIDTPRGRAYQLDEIERVLAIAENLHPDHWPRWMIVVAECIAAGSAEYVDDGPMYIRPVVTTNTRACVPSEGSDARWSKAWECVRVAIIEAVEQARSES